MKTFMRIGLSILLLIAMGFAFAPGTFADGDTDNLVLKVHVQSDKDEQVKISVPLSIIETLHNNLPKEIKKEFADLGPNPADILKELKNMNGMDIVRIEGEENIRVWVEEAKRDDEKALKFISVQIEDRSGDETKINVCLPVGLVALFSQSVQGIVEAGHLHEREGFVLPEEIKKALRDLKKMAHK